MRSVTALPAAGASTESDSTDLRLDVAGPVGANLEAHAALPDLPNLADGETITVGFEDSDDDSSFAPLEQMGSMTVTGAGGAGAEAVSQRFLLPPDCRRYLRAAIAASATAGDNTGSDLTVDFRV